MEDKRGLNKRDSKRDKGGLKKRDKIELVGTL